MTNNEASIGLGQNNEVLPSRIGSIQSLAFDRIEKYPDFLERDAEASGSLINEFRGFAKTFSETDFYTYVFEFEDPNYSTEKHTTTSSKDDNRYPYQLIIRQTKIPKSNWDRDLRRKIYYMFSGQLKTGRTPQSPNIPSGEEEELQGAIAASNFKVP